MNYNVISLGDHNRERSVGIEISVVDVVVDVYQMDYQQMSGANVEDEVIIKDYVADYDGHEDSVEIGKVKVDSKVVQNVIVGEKIRFTGVNVVVA